MMEKQQQVEELKCELIAANEIIWPMVVNDYSGGRSVFCTKIGGEPILGRFRGGFYAKLLDLLEKASMVDGLNFELATLQSSIIWIAFNLNRKEAISPKTGSRSIEECLNLPNEEKIKKCKAMLEYINSWLGKASFSPAYHLPVVEMTFHHTLLH